MEGRCLGFEGRERERERTRGGSGCKYGDSKAYDVEIYNWFKDEVKVNYLS